MKIIHSYWTKPIDSSDENIRSGRESGGWLAPKYNLMSWALSCLKFKQFYRDISLITDRRGKDMLVDFLKLPYTAVSTALDVLDSTNHSIWSLGKMYAYGMQNKPFIHADADFFIWKKFPGRIENGKLVAQHIEKDRPLYHEGLKIVESTFVYKPDILKERKYILAINAGIIGGSDITFLKQYSRAALDFIERNKIPWAESNNGYLNLIAEQYLFYNMARKQRKKIEVLFPGMKEDFEECLRFHLMPVKSSYAHAIGDSKKTKITCSMIDKMLKFHFPEYHSRIQKLFEKDEKLVLSENEKFERYTEKLFSRNLQIWSSLKPRNIYDAKFQLADSVTIKSSVTTTVPIIEYYCPLDHSFKTMDLDGADQILLLLREPNSVNGMIKNIDYDKSDLNQEKVLKQNILNLLAGYMNYHHILALL